MPTKKKKIEKIAGLVGCGDRNAFPLNGVHHPPDCNGQDPNAEGLSAFGLFTDSTDFHGLVQTCFFYCWPFFIVCSCLHHVPFDMIVYVRTQALAEIRRDEKVH